MPKTAKVAEREVAGAVKSFMALNGWRVFRMQSGKFAAAAGIITIGEPGMCDLLCMRVDDGVTRVVWIETLSPNDKRRCRCMAIALAGTRGRCNFCDKKNWQDRVQRDGFTVVNVSDFDEFVEWYGERYGSADARRPGQMQLLR